jgi:delta14-sterol reductase
MFFSFAAHHVMTQEDINPGFIAGAAMLSWFLWEYLYFEKVHLYTYDFIAERVGFKLGFGCLAFYPYFYAVSLWATIDLPNPRLSLWVSLCFCTLYLFGWALARGANMQKYYFKTQGDRKFLGLKPETISDGKHSLFDQRLLGPEPAYQLPGGDTGRLRHCPDSRVSRRLVGVAVPLIY